MASTGLLSVVNGTVIPRCCCHPKMLLKISLPPKYAAVRKNQCYHPKYVKNAANPLCCCHLKMMSKMRSSPNDERKDVTQIGPLYKMLLLSPPKCVRQSCRPQTVLKRLSAPKLVSVATTRGTTHMRVYVVL